MTNKKRGRRKKEEITIPVNYQINLNKLKRIDPKLALWVYEIVRKNLVLYFQLHDAQKSEARAWEENNALKIELAKLKEQIDIKDTIIVRLKSELKTKSERVANLEAQVRTFLERIGVAEQLYATLIQQIIMLKKKIAELSSEDIRDIIEGYMIRIERTINKIEDIIRRTPEIIITEKGDKSGKTK